MIEIKQQKNNTYQFRLKAAGGKTLLKSIDFKSLEEIEQTVQQLSPLTNDYNVIERKTNYDGNFMFNLKDQSGRVIGKSLLYNSEAGMENGISNLKRSIRSLSKSGR
ncbi:MAG: YegP family protein [Flavobacteriaceae bacterium]